MSMSRDLLLLMPILTLKRDVDGGGYGQNLAAGTTEDKIGDAITDMWYNGMKTDRMEPVMNTY